MSETHDVQLDHEGVFLRLSSDGSLPIGAYAVSVIVRWSEEPGVLARRTEYALDAAATFKVGVRITMPDGSERDALT
jgi:hypothetical protein